MRSITSKRDNNNTHNTHNTNNTNSNGLYTLTYDEISILFRRYQGKQKGTIQYTSDLLLLLDTPSWSIILTKLITLYNTSITMGYDMKDGLIPYGDNKGYINKSGIKEYMKMLFERLGIPIKSEEMSILSHQLVLLTIGDSESVVGSGSGMGSGVGVDRNISTFASQITSTQDTNTKKRTITSTTNTTITKLMDYCASEANRIQWLSLGKKFS